MTDETYTFEQTRIRLDGILVEVRKKDTSLEQSLELLEEGVRLLNQCNELIDQTAWRSTSPAIDETGEAADDAQGAPGGEPPEVAAAEGADAETDDPAANSAADIEDDERD